MPVEVEPSAPLDAEHTAMEKLRWGPRELYLASFAYGSVGDESDVRRHLATGDHLGMAEQLVLAAALNDALIEQGETFRVVKRGPALHPEAPRAW